MNLGFLSPAAKKDPNQSLRSFSAEDGTWRNCSLRKSRKERPSAHCLIVTCSKRVQRIWAVWWVDQTRLLFSVNFCNYSESIRKIAFTGYPFAHVGFSPNRFTRKTAHLCKHNSHFYCKSAWLWIVTNFFPVLFFRR